MAANGGHLRRHQGDQRELTHTNVQTFCRSFKDIHSFNPIMCIPKKEEEVIIIFSLRIGGIPLLECLLFHSTVLNVNVSLRHPMIR